MENLMWRAGGVVGDVLDLARIPDWPIHTQAAELSEALLNCGC